MQNEGGDIMAGFGKQREPIELILAKGKKHLTKDEIEERKNSEVNTDDYKNVNPPSYLSKKQKNEFKEIATKLVNIGIMCELDEDCLARYLISKDNYLKFTKILNTTYKNKVSKKYQDNVEMQKVLSSDIESYLIHQDRAFKQCRQSAMDLGLTISSRCRLVIPNANPKTEPKENKFAKFCVS